METTKKIILDIPLMMNLSALFMLTLVFPHKNVSPAFNSIIILLNSCLTLYSITMYSTSMILPGIIFLVFVGGVMVVMMYFICFVDYKNNLSFNTPKLYMCLLIFIPLSYIYFKNMKIYLPYFPDNMNTMSIMEMIQTGSMASYAKLSHIYLWENAPILIYLVLFMVFCFITMTKMCLTNKYKNIRKM